MIAGMMILACPAVASEPAQLRITSIGSQCKGQSEGLDDRCVVFEVDSRKLETPLGTTNINYSRSNTDARIVLSFSRDVSSFDDQQAYETLTLSQYSDYPALPNRALSIYLESNDYVRRVYLEESDDLLMFGLVSIQIPVDETTSEDILSLYVIPKNNLVDGQADVATLNWFVTCRHGLDELWHCDYNARWGYGFAITHQKHHLETIISETGPMKAQLAKLLAYYHLPTVEEFGSFSEATGIESGVVGSVAIKFGGVILDVPSRAILNILPVFLEGESTHYLILSHKYWNNTCDLPGELRFAGEVSLPINRLD